MKTTFVLFIISAIIYNIYCQQTLVDVSTQALCTQSAIQNPSGENRWAQAGLDTNVDIALKCGDIIAFKIESFPVGSGKWTDWYVVGVNDIDTKTDGSSLTVKRMWSYFADHRHQYIICTQNKFKGCAC
ncbi:unnamed protein product [Adineta steineri]|uniref:Uncharacterized protein n=1 Tax=Adineta steineri TaxID=433720 RepID=A0A813P8A8_9BILA|nr:unnamed protein product [Adineta steineri]CAF0748927.1 unnamed protein product [Adineta steineri]CAF3687102.1 unnamed protein product [Adineta steineri]CAF3904184.1 unnamed protein product [Adineta steineri]